MTTKELPLLARQPILDLDLNIVAYELLCRPTPEDTQAWQNHNGDSATSEVLISAFHDIGIDLVTGGTPAYVNFTPFWIQNPPAMPANILVAEILEYIDPTPENINALKKLRAKGYRLALDDYDGSEDRAVFIPYVHIVKIDIRRLASLDSLAAIIHKHRAHDILWLAEKVENQAEFDACKAAGCQLFQGYFFSHPAPIYGKRLLDNQISVLQILQVLNKQNVSIDELARVLKSDPQLSYKILKIVNSAEFSFSREITSVHDAIMLLGVNRLRAWANVIALGKLNQKPYVLREQAIVRAILCKILCKALPQSWHLDEEAAFTIGLFSLLPAFLDHSIEDISHKLNLPKSMTDALLHQAGRYGLVLKITIAMEQGQWGDIDWESLKQLGIEPSRLEQHYLQSLKSTQELLDSLTLA